MFLDTNAGTRYWAEMINNCLHKNASFRFLKIKLAHNIATGGNLATSYFGTRYKKRVFIYNGKNLRGKLFENSKNHRLKQTDSGSLFFYERYVNSCAQPDANGTYIDQKIDGCKDTAKEKFTFGKFFRLVIFNMKNG